MQTRAREETKWCVKNTRHLKSGYRYRMWLHCYPYKYLAWIHEFMTLSRFSDASRSSAAHHEFENGKLRCVASLSLCLAVAAPIKLEIIYHISENTTNFSSLHLPFSVMPWCRDAFTCKYSNDCRRRHRVANACPGTHRAHTDNFKYDPLTTFLQLKAFKLISFYERFRSKCKMTRNYVYFGTRYECVACTQCAPSFPKCHKERKERKRKKEKKRGAVASAPSLSVPLFDLKILLNKQWATARVTQDTSCSLQSLDRIYMKICQFRVVVCDKRQRQGMWNVREKRRRKKHAGSRNNSNGNVNVTRAL